MEGEDATAAADVAGLSADDFGTRRFPLVFFLTSPVSKIVAAAVAICFFFFLGAFSPSAAASAIFELGILIRFDLLFAAVSVMLCCVMLRFDEM